MQNCSSLPYASLLIGVDADCFYYTIIIPINSLMFHAYVSSVSQYSISATRQAASTSCCIETFLFHKEAIFNK